MGICNFYSPSALSDQDRVNMTPSVAVLMTSGLPKRGLSFTKPVSWCRLMSTFTVDWVIPNCLATALCVFHPVFGLRPISYPDQIISPMRWSVELTWYTPVMLSCLNEQGSKCKFNQQKQINLAVFHTLRKVNINMGVSTCKHEI